MRKLIVVATASAFLIGSLSTGAVAAAAPKIGSACPKVGKFFDTPNVRYVCNKEGKKNVWRQWSPPASKENNSNSSAATNSPKQPSVPFLAKIPITLPVAQTGSITFANAVSKFASIPEVAWQRVQDVIAGNSEVNIETTLYIGPTTGTTKELVLPLLQKNFRLFQGFSQPTSYFGLIYDGKDEPWAEKQLETILKVANLSELYSRYLNVMRGACDLSNASNPDCSGGNALILFPTTGAASLYGVQEPYWNAANQNAGPMSQVNHEYTHTVQFAQWFGAPISPGRQSSTDEAHTKMPCWFQEGQANAIGISVWATDLKTYTGGARKANIARGVNPNLPKPTLNTYTAASFAKFLYEQDPLTCYNPSSGDYQLGYSVGYAATEALIAIGGPQATMALLTRMAAGDNWSSAFEKVYGISWKEGSTALGAILEAEYAVLPLGSQG
jgi:hypothetical protein